MTLAVTSHPAACVRSRYKRLLFAVELGESDTHVVEEHFSGETCRPERGSVATSSKFPLRNRRPCECRVPPRDRTGEGLCATLLRRIVRRERHQRVEKQS